MGRWDGHFGIIPGTILLILLGSAILPLGAPQTTVSIWSGVLTFPDGVVIDDDEIVLVDPSTTIMLGDGESIDVKGRLTLHGQTSGIVTLDSIDGKHNGIRFLEESRDLGSSIKDLRILNSSYGISVFNSNPTIQNATIINPDFVGVDLFSGSDPFIMNLSIISGGQDVHGISNTWRYGIGLSVGSTSSPIVSNLQADGLITRGLNIWGGSGGIFRNLSIANISGATLAVSTGIWVEDSVLLIQDSNIVNSDNGIFVRHISEGYTTRPTIENTKVSNSKYRGLMIEQYNRSKWNELTVNAVVRNVSIVGTGSPMAQFQNLGLAALEMNTSGAIISGLKLSQNHAPGIKAYMIDGTTTFENVISDGDGSRSISAGIGETAGIYLRSANWPVKMHDIKINNSQGPGILLWKGGAIGSNWTVNNSGGAGVDIREFHPVIDGLNSSMNQLSGVQIKDSSNVRISNAVTSHNGMGALSNSDGAGFYFIDSNDVVSSGKDVVCEGCRSHNDRTGFSISNSIDLKLLNISSHSPTSGYSVIGEGSGLQRTGWIEINGADIRSEDNQSLVVLDSIDAHFNDFQFNGGSFQWSGRGSTKSTMNNTRLSNSDGCVRLSNFVDIQIQDLHINCTSNHKPTFYSTNASMIDITMNGPTTINATSGSQINWISSSLIDDPITDGEESVVHVSWYIEMEIINQNGYGLPYANVDLNFDEHDQNTSVIVPYSGKALVGPFVQKSWNNSTGWSPSTSVQVNCTYSADNGADHIFITSEIPLDQDLEIVCVIVLPNQEPFIMWATPVEGDVFSSSELIVFNASESWDMDNDVLTFTWIDLTENQTILGPSSEISAFTANDPNSDSPNISDGTHQIKLMLCDSTGKCVSETRNLTLLNLPPTLTVDARPKISPFGVMSLGMTANATIDLHGTTDPEGDPLQCWLSTSYGENITLTPPCERNHEVTFTPQDDTFSVAVWVSDDYNSPSSWTFFVEHYNQLPTLEYEITRFGNTSSDFVQFSFLGSIDPEGDGVYMSISSDIQGILWSGSASVDGHLWQGMLSSGRHTLTLEVWDDFPDNAGRSTSKNVDIDVWNSNPVSAISFPTDGYETNSSEMLEISSIGSGDRDLQCSRLPSDGLGYLCSRGIGFNDLVSVTWTLEGASEILSNDWIFTSRLPAGNHVLRLTIDDGKGIPSTSEVNITVASSAPVIIIDSPVQGQYGRSDQPIKFDISRSFDPENDDFTVKVFSDKLAVPVMDVFFGGHMYESHLPSGVHNLTFLMRDSTGLESSSTVTVTVLPSSPIPVISAPVNGAYIPPGDPITLDSFGTVDHDGDLETIEWFLESGTLIGIGPLIEVDLPPGQHVIKLRASDSRGGYGETAVSVVIGSSAPMLSSLNILPTNLVQGEPQEITIEVSLIDLDGSTREVYGTLTTEGKPVHFDLNDDGILGDRLENDGIWSRTVDFFPEGGSWVRLDVWARDGDTVSPTLTETIPINEEPDESKITNFVLISVSILLPVMLLIGRFAYMGSRNAMRADLEKIESWGNFSADDEEFARK